MLIYITQANDLEDHWPVILFLVSKDPKFWSIDLECT